jgi:hypothetical protein
MHTWTMSESARPASDRCSKTTDVWSPGAGVELRVSGTLSPRHGPRSRRALRPGRRGHGDGCPTCFTSCRQATPGRKQRGRSDGTAGGRACSRCRPTSTQPLPNSQSGVGTASRRSFRARKRLSKVPVERSMTYGSELGAERFALLTMLPVKRIVRSSRSPSPASRRSQRVRPSAERFRWGLHRNSRPSHASGRLRRTSDNRQES